MWTCSSCKMKTAITTCGSRINHVCWLHSQLNKYGNKNYICDYCLHACTSVRILAMHVERCKQPRPQLTKMPADGEKLHFTTRNQQHPLPFIIVGDFETINELISTTIPDPRKPSTTAYANLTPCSAAYKIISIDPNYYSPPRLFNPIPRGGRENLP